jgi:hypothetical protein
MKMKSVIFLSLLLISSMVFAGQSREEMGVKFNQKKPDHSQSSGTTARSNESKGTNTDAKDNARAEPKDNQSLPEKLPENTPKQ